MKGDGGWSDRNWDRARGAWGQTTAPRWALLKPRPEGAQFRGSGAQFWGVRTQFWGARAQFHCRGAGFQSSGAQFQGSRAPFLGQDFRVQWLSFEVQNFRVQGLSLSRCRGSFSGCGISKFRGSVLGCRGSVSGVRNFEVQGLIFGVQELGFGVQVSPPGCTAPAAGTGGCRRRSARAVARCAGGAGDTAAPAPSPPAATGARGDPRDRGTPGMRPEGTGTHSEPRGGAGQGSAGTVPSPWGLSPPRTHPGPDARSSEPRSGDRLRRVEPATGHLCHLVAAAEGALRVPPWEWAARGARGGSRGGFGVPTQVSRGVG